jgi:hypothetical protein
MTALAELRADLADAIDDAGVRVSTRPGAEAVPYALIYGQAIAARPGPGGTRLATFRVVLVAGKADQAAMTAELGDLAVRVLTALWALAGWAVGDVGPDTIRTLGGADHLTADVTASALFISAIPT